MYAVLTAVRLQVDMQYQKLTLQHEDLSTGLSSQCL
jgi:hypothetical protein